MDSFKWSELIALIKNNNCSFLAIDSLNLENAWRKNKECSKQIITETICTLPSFKSL